MELEKALEPKRKRNTQLAEEMGLDLVVSYSQFSRYLSCERAYSYEYRDGFRPHFASNAMALGSVTHRLLDRWWAGEEVSTFNVDEIAASMIVDKALPSFDACQSTAEHALWLMRRYDKMYASSREGVSLLEVEQVHTFELPQLGERRYGVTCVIDKLFHSEQHGGNVFMDHKTVGQMPREDWVDIDPQFSLYFSALRADGIEMVCAFLDCLYTYRWRKKGRTLDWDETSEADSFRRVLVDRSDAMLNVVEREAYAAADRMWHLRQGNHEPLRNISSNCAWCFFRAPCYESLQGDFASEASVLDEHFTEKNRPALVQSLPDMEIDIA